MRDIAIEERGTLRVLSEQREYLSRQRIVSAAGIFQKRALLRRRKIRRRVK